MIGGNVMKSKHPELRELAYAAYAAIRRWEESNEQKETQTAALEDPAGGHAHGDDCCSAGSCGHGFTGSDDPGYRPAASGVLDRVLR